MRRWLATGLVMVTGGVLVFHAQPADAASKRQSAQKAESVVEHAAPQSTPMQESAPTTSAEPNDGGTSCAATVSRKVQDHYESVRDMTARFSQISQVVSLGAAAAAPGAPSSGEVNFAKPGKMRWSYEQPEPSLVVTDGEDLWLYDPAEKEAQRMRSSQGFLSGAALQFLLGHGEMARDFRVKALQCGKEEALLHLAPRHAAAYEKLEIRVDAATGAVKETAVFDLVGNVTRVVFQDVRTNTGLTDDLFRFTPPGDVRIVEVPTAQP